MPLPSSSAAIRTNVTMSLPALCMQDASRIAPQESHCVYLGNKDTDFMF